MRLRYDRIDLAAAVIAGIAREAESVVIDGCEVFLHHERRLWWSHPGSFPASV